MTATPRQRRAATICKPYPAGATTPLSVTVGDLSVLAIARRLHDEKCFAGQECSRRDGHSLDSFEGSVRKTLGALVEARAAQEI